LPLGDLAPVAIPYHGFRDGLVGVTAGSSDALVGVTVNGELVTARSSEPGAGWLREFRAKPVTGERPVVASGGGVVAVGGDDGRVRLRGVRGDESPKEIDTKAAVHGLAVSADGKWLATSSFAIKPDVTSALRVWALSDGKEVNCWKMAPRVVALSPDGVYLAVAEYHRVDLYDVKNGQVLRSLPAPGDEIEYLTFLPDGSGVVAVGEAGVIRRWETKTGKSLDLGTGHTAPVTAVRFTPGGGIVTAGADGTARLWDATGKEVRRFEGHKHGIVGLALSRDGRALYTAGGVNDGTVRAWDTETAAELRTCAGARTGAGWGQLAPTALVLSADGKTLALGLSDGPTRLLDPETFKEKPSADPAAPALRLGSGARALAFAGSRLVTRERFTFRVWDGATGKALQSAGGAAGKADTSGLAVSPDGKWFAAPQRSEDVRERIRDRGKYLGIWDTDTGKPIDRFDIGTGNAILRPDLTAVAFALDGATVVVGDEAGNVWAVDIATKAVPRRLGAHNGQILALAVAPDGKTVASGGADSSVLVWKLADR
jgi:WD40 repeat protein